MENIGWFSDFVRAFGVQQEYGFVTVDLFEKQNVNQVRKRVVSLTWDKWEKKRQNYKTQRRSTVMYHL